MEDQIVTGREIRIRKILGTILKIGLVGLAIAYSLATFLMGMSSSLLIIAAGYLPFLLDSAIFTKFDPRISMLSRVRFVSHISLVSLRTFAYFLMGFLFWGDGAMREVTTLSNLGFIVIIVTLFLAVTFFDVAVIFIGSKKILLASLCSTLTVSALIIWIALAPGRLFQVIHPPKEEIVRLAYEAWSPPVTYAEIKDIEGKYTIGISEKTYSRTLYNANNGDHVVFFDDQMQIVGSGIIGPYYGRRIGETGNSKAEVSFTRKFSVGDLLTAQFAKKGPPHESSPDHWRRNATGDVVKNIFIVRDFRSDSIRDRAARASSSEIILKNILTVKPNDIVIGNKDANVKVFLYFSLYDNQVTRRALVEEGLLGKYPDTVLVVRPILRENNSRDVRDATYEYCAHRLGNFVEFAKIFYGRTNISETELEKALLDQRIDKNQLSTCVVEIKNDKSYFPYQYFYGGTYITINGELPKNATTSLEIKEQLAKFLNFNENVPILSQ